MKARIKTPEEAKSNWESHLLKNLPIWKEHAVKSKDIWASQMAKFIGKAVSPEIKESWAKGIEEVKLEDMKDVIRNKKDYWYKKLVQGLTA